jgi:SAM-dependent methyltransferase
VHVACVACGADHARRIARPTHWLGPETFRDVAGELGLVRCRKCGLVYVDPRPGDALLAEFYARGDYSCHDVAGSSSAGADADHVLGEVEPHLPRDAPRAVLDFGAGGGGFLLHARAVGWEARGFEPGRRGRENCRAAGLAVEESLDALPRSHFGLVTLHHVLEHLTDPVATLRSLQPFLARAGRLLVAVPNARSLRARLSLPILSRYAGFDERFRAFPLHLVYYDAGTLARVLRRAGWTVERTFTMGLGVEELLRARGADGREGAAKRAPRRPRKETGPAAGAEPRARRGGGRRLRRTLRDLFLRSGLGENLGAVARPP